MSIFRRSKSKSQLASSTSSAPTSASHAPPLPTKSNSASTRKPRRSSSVQSLTTKHVDDFGRVLDKPSPAFLGPDGVNAPGARGQQDDDEGKEFALLYGYAPLETTLELSVPKVEALCSACADEIRTRGLDTPLILSSMALDLSLEGSCSLIRAYLGDAQAWAYDLHLATPLAVGAHLKWGLGRLVNDRGGRGFVSWDAYFTFQQAEKEQAYPARFASSGLIDRLPLDSGKLLLVLLSLFSSVAAHSSKNGMPPRKIAALFGPLLFGLADDQPFEATYQEWQRSTDATEHILLAFIREQQAQGQLPTHLVKFIADYPRHLNVSSEHAPPKVPLGARVEDVIRIRRLTRFHSRNLIQSAGTWEVPRSSNWPMFFPLSGQQANSPQPVLPQYTSSYRHLLNIRYNPLLDDEEDEGEMQRYKTVVEKEWSMFGERGFKDDVSAKLEFDLTESERNPKAINRQTLDWSTFTDSGFGGRETFSPADLIFHQNISTQVKTGPSHQQQLTARLRETEAMLPPFPYDTTAQEIGRVAVDALFFEAWADILVSGGWARDELKESNFALLHWKARGRDGELSNENARYCLVEEIVPVEYRDALVEGKQKKQNKRISFMRAVRRTTTKKGPSASTMPAPVSNYSQQPPGPSSISLRPVDESVFAPGGGATKQVSLGSDLRSANGSYIYVPSVISSTGAGHGHESYAETIDAGGRRSSQDTVSTIGPSRPSGAIPGTITSQRVASPQPVVSQPNSAKTGQGMAAPIGYTKPPQKTGLFSRLGGTKKKKQSAPAAMGSLSSIEGSPSFDGPESDDFEAPSPSDEPAVAHSDANGNGVGARPAGMPEYQSYAVDTRPTPTSGVYTSYTVAPNEERPAPAGGVYESYAVDPNDQSNGNTQLNAHNGRLQSVVDRSSAYSQVSNNSISVSSPYTDTTSENGGYDEDDPALEIGRVMFRGSLVPSEHRPEPVAQNSFEAAEAAYAQAHGVGQAQAVPDSPRAKAAWVRPARNASLTPNGADELPTDEDVRLGYTSGASQYSSRVKNIVGMMEGRNESS